jgi:hypothetical protein
MSSRYQAGIVLPGYNALKVANAPTIGTATSASGTSVSVTFTAPACTGGGAISAYTVFANCGVKTASGASSPLVVTGLTTGTAYTFKAIATNAYGPSYPSAASNSATPVAAGQDAYVTAGSYSWVAPAGVTSVSVVAVAPGGQGAGGNNGGGGLGYKNNYTVIPTNSYTVVVGSNADSYFVSTAVVKGGFGSPNTGGTYTGDGGGNGGSVVVGDAGYNGGGGGAGGYSGNGGNGATKDTSGGPACGSNGSGGGGGGGGNNAGGGGVGILGQGANGTGGAPNTNGTAGSGGSGATYGGAKSSGGGGTQGSGAVRIIYPGTTRSFPSTCTGDL